MADFMKKNAKWIILIYGIIIGLLILTALFYMTNVANVHIAYDRYEGAISFGVDSRIKSVDIADDNLFNYFKSNKDAASPFLASTLAEKYETVDAAATDNILKYGVGGISFAQIIYNFQTEMSSFNTMIVIFGVISLVAFAIMLVFANHSRKVYYSSNLFVGITMPLIVAVLSIVLLIRNLTLLGTFNSNIDLFRVTSFMMDPNIAKIEKGTLGARSDYSKITNYSTNFNTLGFTLLTVVSILILVYSVFLIVYTIYRYKECAKKRNDILERAANNND